ALSRKLEGLASDFVAEAAQRDAVLGKCQQIRAKVPRVLAPRGDAWASSRAVGALAMCGEVSQAQSFVDDMTKRLPQNTYANKAWSLIIRAEIEIYRGHPAQ